MKPNVRTCIAYIAGCLLTKKTFVKVLDQSRNNTIEMTGGFERDNIDVLEHGSGSKILGLAIGRDASFTHYGENITITLTLKGDSFTGFDGGSNKGFNGTLMGRSVKLYDYDDAKHYYYSLSE